MNMKSSGEQSLAYDLFFPENWDDGRKYPLVLYMHDLGGCTDDPQNVLEHDEGASVWSRPEEQALRPCFVVVPAYPRKTTSDGKVTWEVEATYDLICELTDNYPIDRDRIYGTGQSMGCMMLYYLMIKHRGLFAAAFTVAGQWDPGELSVLRADNIWILVSEKDFKAYPTMLEAVANMEKDGARVSRGTLPGDEPDKWDELIHEQMKEGTSVNFTAFAEPEQSADLDENGNPTWPGAFHKTTWLRGYKIPAIREWIFMQHR